MPWSDVMAAIRESLPRRSDETPAGPPPPRRAGPMALGTFARRPPSFARAMREALGIGATTRVSRDAVLTGPPKPPHGVWSVTPQRED